MDDLDSPIKALRQVRGYRRRPGCNEQGHYAERLTIEERVDLTRRLGSKLPGHKNVARAAAARLTAPAAYQPGRPAAAGHPLDSMTVRAAGLLRMPGGGPPADLPPNYRATYNRMFPGISWGAFVQMHAPAGYRVKDFRVWRGPGVRGMAFAFTIESKAGEKVAEARREYRHENGESIVHHLWLEVSKDLRGQGEVAWTLLINAVANYRAMGFVAVRLKAADKTGRLAWAQYGFEAEDPKHLEAMKQALRGELRRVGQEPAEYEDLVDLLDEPWLIAAFHPRGMPPVRPHHYQVRKQEVKNRDMTLGARALLSGPEWRGRLDLRDGARSFVRFLAYTRG